MIHPSYVDLMNVVNKDAAEGETPIINSRYSIVMATAKRARQIVDGDAPMVDEPIGRKPLSIAIDELQEEQLHILPQDEAELQEIELEEMREARSREAEFSRLSAAAELMEDEESGDTDNAGANSDEAQDTAVTEE